MSGEEEKIYLTELFCPIIMESGQNGIIFSFIRATSEEELNEKVRMFGCIPMKFIKLDE